MTEKVFRFTITGDEESRLHGRHLRREIKGVADLSKPPLKGSVRNTKGKPEIEVFAVVQKPEDVVPFIKELKKIKELEWLDIGETGIHEIGYKDANTYTDFEIIREDELTEMVWALQGAGDVFKKTNDIIETRDENKKKAILTSLIFELDYISEKISEEIADGGLGHIDIGALRVLCLESNIKTPAFLDKKERFVILIHELYGLLRELPIHTAFEKRKTTDEIISNSINKVINELKEIIQSEIGPKKQDDTGTKDLSKVSE